MKAPRDTFLPAALDQVSAIGCITELITIG
jgi:hypothetical protein